MSAHVKTHEEKIGSLRNVCQKSLDADTGVFTRSVEVWPDSILALLDERDQLRARVEELEKMTVTQVDYSTALGRLIEHTARGDEAPKSLCDAAPYHARILKLLRARVEELEAEVVRLRGVLSELASEACAGDAICSTMEPDRDLVIANGVDPDVCQCFRATARKALQS